MSDSSLIHPTEATAVVTTTSEIPPQDVIASILNINVGILGHVDSGKTSLVKAMSTLLSTASLDKSKQSRERGMTLDLGFSCFFVDTVPEHLQKRYPNKKQLQITLVDCPGHASLIRTIIGGAQIIDIVLLVVDAVKGWQAQTTECVVLAELCTSQIVIALNKIDSIPIMERETKLNEVRKQIQQVHLQRTRFANMTTTIPMIGVSACIGGEKVAAIINNMKPHQEIRTDNDQNSIIENNVAPTADNSNNNNENAVSNGITVASTNENNETMNIDLLISTLIEHIPIPQRIHNDCNNSKDKHAPAFYFAIDHCFPMRGRGTVITGTCLSGRISVNDTIEFPTVSVERKIKSMQMFKRSVTTISQGDRAGICVSHFDATTIERSIAAAPPGTVQLWKGAIAIVKKVAYYPNKLVCNSKFHISVGHTTIMATVSFWGGRELATLFATNDEHQVDDTSSTTTNSVVIGDSKYNNPSKSHTIASSFGGSADLAGLPRLSYNYNQDFVYQDGLLESLDEHENNENGANSATTSSSSRGQLLNWAVLEFQTPIHCPMHCLVIGSRLDTVDNATRAASLCRLAFSGRLIERLATDTIIQ
jgi:selenocysteine-specific elongation factor